MRSVSWVSSSGWITPRKIYNSNAHDEKFARRGYHAIVDDDSRSLDAWALQNQADATIDGAH